MTAIIKWGVIFLIILALLFFSYVTFMVFVTNPKVADELRAQPNGERASKVMLLTFTDGKTIPVNYLEESGKVFVGADGPCWREFAGGSTVTMLIRGNSITGRARTVLDNDIYIADVFSRLRPTVPTWLPAWLNGKLVEITPDSR